VVVRFRQKVALVTGGTRGIGKGIALGLAAEGARVCIAYRSNRTTAQNALRELQARGAEAFAVQADVTEPSKAQFLVDTVAERFGRLDILVNNVGEFRWRPVADSTVEEWKEILASNLLSVFYVCKAALPILRKQRWGRIVNLGAVGAERAFGQATISAYASAKAAVVAFSRSLAIEEAKYGITINVVSPSNVDEKELTIAEATRIRDARFPVPKTLDEFQWSWPKKLNRLQVQNLFRLAFVDTHTNVVFLGNVGLGKTHLCIALGYTACLRGLSVLFTTAVDIINTLAAAQSTGALKREMNRYLKPRILIVDELGYLPIDKRGADLLFQIISQRYERGPIVITTNRAYKTWAEIFNNDSTLTSALLDRLLHHAETVVIEGKSFRRNEQTEN